MTQERQVLNHLDEYGSIDPITAFTSYRIMRLAAVIHELKADGVPIETEIRYGNGKRWAVYKYAAPRRATENGKEGEDGRLPSDNNTDI